MKYLHTMIRITDIETSLHFFCQVLGMTEVRRVEHEKGRFTLIFLAADQDLLSAKNEGAPTLELTYNWDVTPYDEGRNFGHLAFSVKNIYTFCQRLIDNNITLNRPPRDGRMAFIKSPDGISIEFLQEGTALPIAEPWQSMPNQGTW